MGNPAQHRKSRRTPPSGGARESAWRPGVATLPASGSAPEEDDILGDQRIAGSREDADARVQQPVCRARISVAAVVHCADLAEAVVGPRRNPYMDVGHEAMGERAGR